MTIPFEVRGAFNWVAGTPGIKAVGNYGEIFERNLGANTPFKWDRGYNNICTNGGLLYSPPFR